MLSIQPKRKHIPSKLRFKVLKRDNFTCQYCGKNAREVKLHIDHIIPVSKGGSTKLSNLITSCIECNLGKSNTIEVVPLETTNPIEYYNSIVGEPANDTNQLTFSSMDLGSITKESELDILKEERERKEHKFYEWLAKNDLIDEITNLKLQETDTVDELNSRLVSFDTDEYDTFELYFNESDIKDERTDKLLEQNWKQLIDDWKSTNITDENVKKYVSKLTEYVNIKYSDADMNEIKRVYDELNLLENMISKKIFPPIAPFPCPDNKTGNLEEPRVNENASKPSFIEYMKHHITSVRNHIFLKSLFRV